MRYDDDLQRTPGRPWATAGRWRTRTWSTGSRPRCWWCCARTRPPVKAATAGCPRGFSAYTGAMVIVDSPDVLAALAEPGGYLATQFLNSNLVPTIAQQVR